MKGGLGRLSRKLLLRPRDCRSSANTALAWSIPTAVPLAVSDTHLAVFIIPLEGRAARDEGTEGYSVEGYRSRRDYPPLRSLMVETRRKKKKKEKKKDGHQYSVLPCRMGMFYGVKETKKGGTAVRKIDVKSRFGWPCVRSVFGAK